MGNVNTTQNSDSELSDTAKDASTNLHDHRQHQKGGGGPSSSVMPSLSSHLSSYRTTRNFTYTTHDDTGSINTYNTGLTNATNTNINLPDSHSNSNSNSNSPARSQENNSSRGQQLLQKIKKQHAQAKHLKHSRSGESSSSSGGGGGNNAVQQSQSHDFMYAPPGEDQDQISPGEITTRTNRARTRSVKKGPLEEEDWKQKWDDDCDSSEEDEEDNTTTSSTYPNHRPPPPPPGQAGQSSRTPVHSNYRKGKGMSDLTRQVDAALKGEGKGAVDWETTTPRTSGSTRIHDKPELSMFNQLRVLGKGSFGKVVLVQKQTGNERGGLFAMKILRKTHLLKRGQIERTRTERQVLSVVDHPFIMKLHFAFQTEDKLFLVLDYCAGGELFFHLSRHRRFPEKYTRFYAAELLLALKYLHSKGIIYRDLKPENVLFDAEGHVKLGDFGLAKANISHYYKGTRSRVGTPEYMSPEVLQKWGHGFCVDFWGLGMLTYEMMTGLPPWYTTNRQELLKRLIRAPLQIPPYFSPQAGSFVRSLLERDPKRRLGVRGSHSVISHEFFRRLDFKALEGRRIEAPILPCEGWKSPVRENQQQTHHKVGGGLKHKFFSGSRQNHNQHQHQHQHQTNPSALTSSGNNAFASNSTNNSNNNNHHHHHHYNHPATMTTKIQSLHSEDLDAATANFDKQFTRMALDSQTSHDYSDDCSEETYDGQELNEHTFVGFTFDDPNDSGADC